MLGEREHVLLLLLHHIAGDGWSMAPLWRDLAAAYAARLVDQAPGLCGAAGAVCRLHAVAASVAWRRGGSARARLRVSWRSGPRRCRDFPSSLICRAIGRGLLLPAIGATALGCTIGAELHRDLLALARDGGASLFMVLQAALAALLTRLGAGTDIPIGSPIAGRTDSALDDLVGFFVNTLVLRTDTVGRSELARTDCAGARHQPGGLWAPGPAV